MRTTIGLVAVRLNSLAAPGDGGAAPENPGCNGERPCRPLGSRFVRGGIETARSVEFIAVYMSGVRKSVMSARR
jgi:hypothetical protein